MSSDETIVPWEEPQDLLDRKQYAEFLTKYLASREHSFVLNLNAGWGMGKTYFLTHWRASIQETHPTVYVNAWESDFSDDPLIAVMSAIYEQLTPLLPDDSKTLDSFAEKLKSGGRFIRGLAPVIGKGLVKKALGDEAGDMLIEPDRLAEVAGKSLSLMLGEQSEKIKAMSDFRVELSELVSAVAGRERPLFLFVDELDRCRPTYAVELLEIIKHLFTVDGIVFVIATDSEQLQHSVRAIYGNDFNGKEYLRRFFDQEYRLPEPDYYEFSQVFAEQVGEKENIGYSSFQPWMINGKSLNTSGAWNKSDSLSTFIGFFAKYFNVSLRSTGQVIVRFEAIIDSSDKKWLTPALLFLLFLQAKDGETFDWIYEHLKKGDADDFSIEINNRIKSGGETVLWLHKKWGQAYGDDRTYQAGDIGRDYINAVRAAFHTSPGDLTQHHDDFNDVRSFILYLIAESLAYKGREEYVDPSTYFEHVYMAGALS